MPKNLVHVPIAPRCMTKTSVSQPAGHVNVLRGHGHVRFSGKSKYPSLAHMLDDHPSMLETHPHLPGERDHPPETHAHLPAGHVSTPAATVLVVTGENRSTPPSIV